MSRSACRPLKDVTDGERSHLNSRADDQLTEDIDPSMIMVKAEPREGLLFLSRSVCGLD